MRPSRTGKGSIDLKVEPINSKTGKVKSNMIVYVEAGGEGQEEPQAQPVAETYRNPDVPPEVESRQRALFNLGRASSKAAGYR